ncbi:MAG: flagellar hook protein FlgE [Leptothrix sp. (in: b-proteobacteria)]
MDFQQGLSGLNATSRNLEVIGNNVANANTYGSKSSRAEFADMYAGAVSGTGTGNIGTGVRLATVSQQFSQGGLTTTSNPLDLAINGAGFFQVKDNNGQPLYTRNGEFKVDSDGYVVNNDGYKLQGYAADPNGAIVPKATSALQLPTKGIAPQATSKITMDMNLDSRSDVTKPTTGDAINFDDPKTYNNATSTSVYDVTGQQVALTYYFQKDSVDAASGDVTWNVFATANGTSVSTDAAGKPSAVTQIKFPISGAAPLPPLDQPITLPDIPATTKTVGGVTSTVSQKISGITLDVSKSTQFGTAFSVSDLQPNGYAPGQLGSVSIGKDGVISASYSNGKTMAVGQLELANFRNPQGLQPLGSNVWAKTPAAGEPITGTPTTGNLGSLQSGSLEDSNVDLTAELVNMITAQRAYQANAQTIKTQDQVLQTLVSLR